MANQSTGTDEFEVLARKYWDAWTNKLHGEDAKARASIPGWDEAFAWWSKQGQQAAPKSHDTVDRLNSQAHQWLEQMHQVAAQFAGQNATAKQVAQAWKQMLAGAGENPFAQMFSSMRGPGQHGVEDWATQAAPFIDALRGGRAWLDTPAFGFAREHQERLQALGQAQHDYQERQQAYAALLAEASQRAFELFENKLTERSEPGRQLASARALFDLWIDAAEEAYAVVALSRRFREVHGAMANAQMKLRSAVQREVELSGAQLGMPTRTEIDAAHRKIAQLERELRRLRDAMQAFTETASRPAAAKPQVKPKPRAAKAPLPKSVKKTAVKKAAVKKSATRAPARKTVATSTRGKR